MPKTAVYLMPGLAASPKIFEYIKLPEDLFEIYYLEWILPLPNEFLNSYAKRICEQIKHQNPVLIGVSFGGIIVQEMATIINVKKTIIISSVKSNQEFPQRIKIAKIIKIYNFLPYILIENFENLAKYALGNTLKQRFSLYKKYLSVNKANYLSWAIKNLILWDRTMADSKIIHIHGSNDQVFPVKNIQNFIELKGGTHIMIIDKFKWFNENLPQIILNN